MTMGIPSWALIASFIYRYQSRSWWLRIGLQVVALCFTDIGASVRAVLGSTSIIWKQWQLLYLNLEYLTSHWVLVTQILFIVGVYCLLQLKQTRVRHWDNSAGTVPVSQTLRGAQLQRIALIKLATSLSDVYGILALALRDRNRGLRYLRYILSPSFQSLALTGTLQAALLLFFSPWTYVMLILIYDFFMLLEVQVGCMIKSNKEDPLLRRGRSQFLFAFVTLCHLLVFPLWFALRHDPRDGLEGLIQACSLSINANMVILLYGSEPNFLESLELDHSGLQKSGFCSICQTTIFRKRELRFALRDRQFPHHWRHRALKKSARDGCRICSAVWEHRRRVPRDFLGFLMFWKPVTSFERNSIQILVISEECRDELQNSCAFDLLKDQDIGLRQVIKDKASDQNQENIGSGEESEKDDADTPDIPESIPLSSYTGSAESLLKARSWLDDCLKGHKCCGRARALLGSRSFKPTRLLQIPVNFEQNPIKLSTIDKCEGRCLRDYWVPSHKHIRGYLTLSHCWGKKEIIRLTKANMQRFMDVGIRFSELPKTFQDAIRITRILGYNYLWIDSLCIIQDSKRDWARESRLMCDIYLNSLCNIQATDAKDSSEGCLFNRDSLLMQIEKAPGGEYISTRTDLVGNHPLQERAWVFQESFLSPRCLDFGRAQIFWKCAQFRASEVFPLRSKTEAHPAMEWRGRFEILEVPTLSVNNLPNLLQHPNRRAHLETKYEKLKFWGEVVQKYSAMKLTKQSDRAVAISGVAEACRPLFGEYAFGSWTTNMPEELLWVNKSKSRTVCRDRAPTWSWLSTEGCISYFYCRDAMYGGDRLARLLGLDVAEQTEPSGDIALHGTVRLSAVVFKATWHGLWHSDGAITLRSVNEQKRHLKIGPVALMTLDYGEVFFDDCCNYLPPEEVYCVPISKTRYDHVMMGLVLEQVAPGIYQRLGVFSTPRFSRDIEHILEGCQASQFSIV